MATKSLYFDLIGRDRSATAALDKVGKQLLVFGAAAAAGVAVAVTKFAEFDAQMSQVQTLSHATSGEMASLRNAALDMGQGIGFSATQVADAETELVKAGVSVKDILGGALTGALNLAAAGQIDVAQATEIASIALTQFKLTGKDVPHVADLLAAGADKALGGVEDLGEALKSGGLVAAQFGVSLDETVGTLSAFANAGLLGETAGTDLRQMLLKLSNPSAEAAKTMKQLGIEIYDSSGKFVGMAGLAGQLKDKMSQLDPATRNAAMATIFGAKAIAGANVLYEQGAKGIAKWTHDVNETGFAAEQAAGKMDNLKGDVSKLGAALDTDLIKAGSGANGILREFTQGATTLVKAIGDIPQPILNAGLAITALAGGAALLGGAFITVVPKIEATRASLVRLGVTGASVGTRMTALSTFLGGPWGVAIAASAVGVRALSQWLDSLQASSIDMQNSLTTAKTAVDVFKTAAKGEDVKYFQNVTNDLKDLPGVLQAAADQSKNLFARFDSTHFGAFDALKKTGEQLAEMSSRDLPAAQRAFGLLAKETDGSQTQLWRLLSTMPAYRDALTQIATEQGMTANKTNLLNLAQRKGESAAKQNAAALAKLSGTAQAAGGDIDDLANKLRDFGKGQLDVNATQRDFQAAIDSVTTTLQGQKKAYEDAHGSLDGWSASLDIGTQEGRDNQAALDGIASSALNAAGAILTQTGSQEDATAAVQQGRDALIAALAQFNITGQAAQDYANKLGLIPGNVTTAVGISNLGDALFQAASWKQTLAEVPRELTTHVGVIMQTSNIPAWTQTGHAGGGDLDYAPGAKGVDSMWFKGAKGEHVLTAGDVDAMGGQQAVYAFRKRLHAGVSSKLAALTQVPDVRPEQLAFMPALDSQPAPAAPAAPTRVEVQVVQKVGGMSINDLIDMRIRLNGEWQSLELSSGVGR